MDPLQNLNYHNDTWEYEAFVINARDNNKFKIDVISELSSPRSTTIPTNKIIVNFIVI